MLRAHFGELGDLHGAGKYSRDNAAPQDLCLWECQALDIYVINLDRTRIDCWRSKKLTLT